MIKIRAFRAVDDYEACMKFIEGHRRLLEIHFGVAKVTSTNIDWVYSENTVVVIVEDETGEKVYGGARVQMVDGKVQLPILILYCLCSFIIGQSSICSKFVAPEGECTAVVTKFCSILGCVVP